MTPESRKETLRIKVPPWVRFSQSLSPFRDVLCAQSAGVGLEDIPGAELIVDVLTLLLEVAAAAGNRIGKAEREKIHETLCKCKKYRGNSSKYIHIYNSLIYILRAIPDPGIEVNETAQIPIPPRTYLNDRLPCSDDCGALVSRWFPVISGAGQWADRQLDRVFPERVDRFVVLASSLLGGYYYIEDFIETVLALTWEQVWLPTRTVAGKKLIINVPHLRVLLKSSTRGCEGAWHQIPLDPAVVAFIEANWPAGRRKGPLFGDAASDAGTATEFREALQARLKKECESAPVTKRDWAELETLGQMAAKSFRFPPLISTAGQGRYRATFTSYTSITAMLSGQAVADFGDTKTKCTVVASTVASRLRDEAKSRRKALISATDANTGYYEVLLKFIKHLERQKHKPTALQISHQQDVLQDILAEARLSGELPENHPVADNIWRLCAWGISEICTKKKPKTVANQLRTMHNWILGYVGGTFYAEVKFEQWVKMLYDYDAGNKQDCRTQFLDFLRYLNVTKKTEVDTEVLFRASFSIKDYPAESVELLGAFEARDIYLSLACPWRWYFAFEYGLGLRIEESHLLTMRRIIGLGRDLYVVVCRSKTDAGSRILPARLLMPPAIYEDFVEYVATRRKETAGNPDAPLIERGLKSMEPWPNKLDSEKNKNELRSVERRLHDALKKVPFRFMRSHDWRRTFSNCFVLRLLELGKVFGGILQPVAHDPQGARWTPVPFATVHELYHPQATRELAHENIDRVAWHLVAMIMGHLDPRTTASTYFQCWLIVLAAWGERRRETRGRVSVP